MYSLFYKEPEDRDLPRLIEKKLNALTVKRLTKPGRHADGGGLYLNVEKNGAKSWILLSGVSAYGTEIGC